MIFITLGSQKFQFNRLLKAIDEIIGKNEIFDEVFAQIGYSDYKPQNYKYKPFLDRQEFIDVIEKSSIVITHGGTGAIVGALKKNKKVIAVPRLSKYNEHVDDHQLQIIEQFFSMGFIEACYELEKLNEKLIKIKKENYNVYVSNTHNIISKIELFLNDIEIM